MSDDLTVPCPICKMPAGSECVSTDDGASRDRPPHVSRVVRAKTVRSAIAENLALEESQ